MWVVRVLSGPQAGQVFPLKAGANLVGRSSGAQVHLMSLGVSKEHLKIEVIEDKIILTDLGSRNGTFLNGIKIKSSRLREGDKLLLNDTFLELAQIPDAWAHSMSPQMPTPMGVPIAYHDYGAAAPNLHAQAVPGTEELQAQARGLTPEQMRGGLQGLQGWIENYLENVLLPGVYKLPELLEFRWVMALIMAGFILMVTSLSTIPLLRILKESIEEESQQHAMTIATNLAQINRPALMQGQDTAVSVEVAQKRPGVKEALIISNIDGNIIAPANKTGSYPDIPFVHEARLKGRPDVAQVSSDTVVAVVPIEFFNAETGSQAVTAYAVVVYDMSTLALDDGKTISLFVQTLFMALIVGSLLFYFMYKMIEHPFKSLNSQLDLALKEGRDDLKVPYEFPALQTLVSNVNSALNRVVNASSMGSASPVLEHDRNMEMGHIVDLIGFPAMALLGADETIACVNPAFEERIGQNSMDLIHGSVDRITDQALKLSVSDLVQRSRETPDQLLTNELEFSGENYQVAIQAVHGSQAVAYYIVVLLPMDGGGEG
jgi:pSer/pThr/pTyr-binding forkhead associated (FHA) protein